MLNELTDVNPIMSRLLQRRPAGDLEEVFPNLFLASDVPELHVGLHQRVKVLTALLLKVKGCVEGVGELVVPAVVSRVLADAVKKLDLKWGINSSLLDADFSFVFTPGTYS